MAVFHISEAEATRNFSALMERVRAAFNPVGRLNPGKVLPMGKACGEIRVPPTPAASAIPT